MPDWKKLILLGNTEKLVIQTHDYPDPDSIASAYGLQQFLKAHNINAEICYGGTISGVTAQNMLNVLPIDIKNVSELNLTSSSKIILVDSQKFNSNITDIIGEEIGCIDHHPTFIECEYKYKDVRLVGSCSTLVSQYFFASGTEMPAYVATALSFGLRTDTDNFTRGVTDEDIEALYKMYPATNKALIDTLVTNTLTVEHLKAYGAAIKNVKIRKHIGFSFIPFDCNDALIGMVSDFMLSVDDMQCTVIYSLRDTGFKISVRSELVKIHAGNLINLALEGIGKGGGHQTMAGGFIPAENFHKLGASVPVIAANVRKRFLRQIEKLTENA